MLVGRLQPGEAGFDQGDLTKDSLRSGSTSRNLVRPSAGSGWFLDPANGNPEADYLQKERDTSHEVSRSFGVNCTCNATELSRPHFRLRPAHACPSQQSRNLPRIFVATAADNQLILGHRDSFRRPHQVPDRAETGIQLAGFKAGQTQTMTESAIEQVSGPFNLGGSRVAVTSMLPN